MTLNREPNIAAPDDFYQELIDLHRELTDEQSALVNAKLILLLANHIGDIDVLRAAMAAAREDVMAPRDEPAPTAASSIVAGSIFARRSAGTIGSPDTPRISRILSFSRSPIPVSTSTRPAGASITRQFNA